MELTQNFDLLYIDQESRNSAVAQRLINKFPEEKIKYVDGPPEKNSSTRLTAEQFSDSKKKIYVAPFKGSFFKRCPGNGKGLSCCNYYVLNLGLQCNMNCSYCYLQSFINTPYSMVYSNMDQALLELQEIYESGKDQSVRVGTGEVIDSLSLDPLTLYSHDLIDFFKDKPNWKLEFKTKSNQVDHFLDQEHSGNVIVSWSLNAQDIVESEEHGTASLSERLEAAVKCRDKGFQVAFHIDPVIWYPEWKAGYENLVNEITSRFQPSELPYLSLGALRFQKEQIPMMKERFSSKSWINRAEVFQSAQGKMRYDQDVRSEMFEFIISKFKAKSSLWKIFLCMETPETWLKSAGENPFRSEELKDLFKPLNL